MALTESQKYLPATRSIKASAHSYTRRVQYLAESQKPPRLAGKKGANLSAYQPQHLALETSPRERQA